MVGAPLCITLQITDLYLTFEITPLPPLQIGNSRVEFYLQIASCNPLPLMQKTRDSKVVEFCRQSATGRKIRETFVDEFIN